MENADVARLLAETGDLLELLGGNAFKVRAYRQAAQVVDTLPTPVAELLHAGRLSDVPTIGERIADHIGGILDRGDFDEHERLVARVPAGVLQILAVPGLGPKTTAALWKKLGVFDLAALEEACRSGRILSLPRMGQRRAESILEALEAHLARAGRVPLHRALTHAESFLQVLRSMRGVVAAEAAGSVRRRQETVGDVDLLVATSDPDPVVRAFTKARDVGTVVAEGPTRCTVRLKGGLQVDLRIVAPESFGSALHYFTGSKTHNIALRTRAMRLGLKLNEYGVFDRQGHRLGGEREEEVFRAVGLPFIPAELREGAGEIEAAETGRLPRLLEEEDLQGDLHVHSRDSSDARATLPELLAEGRSLGRRYLAITDHSRSRPLGLDDEHLARQAATIRGLDRRHRGPPRLLTGVEVDILPDGGLDLDPETLTGLDCVVASVHSHFKDAPGRMTDRLVTALRSGVVHVLGHPSGRQIGHRDPYAFDLARVLRAARENGVALELNAQPERLDLNDKGCRLAKAAGVPVVISSDAHFASQLGNLRYGVFVARRGWLEKGDVLNTLALPELRRRLGRRRSGARSGKAREEVTA
jgi:DNA polymerase (family 10)